MRRKLLLLTLGLASSIWSAGCQHRSCLPCAEPCTCCGHVSSTAGCSHATAGCGQATAGCGLATSTATESRPFFGAARRTQMVRPSAAPMVIYTEEPDGTYVASEDELPWVETVPPPAAPIAPRLRPQQPIPASDYEAPLPPPSFPSLLPAPARGSLQPSQFEEVIIRDVPGSQVPVEYLPSMPSEGVPVILPNGDQLIELGSKTISFGAGDNYRSLTGEVQQFRRGWRLRYAAVDAEDAYGGSVNLVGQGLERLRDGVHVRVTGTLIPAEDRLSSPRFQVQALEMLEP